MFPPFNMEFKSNVQTCNLQKNLVFWMEPFVAHLWWFCILLGMPTLQIGFSCCLFPFGFTPFWNERLWEVSPAGEIVSAHFDFLNLRAFFYFVISLSSALGFILCVSALKCRSLLFRFWFVFCDIYNLFFDPSPLNCAPVSPVGNDAPCGRDFRQIYLAIMEDRYHPDQPNSKSRFFYSQTGYF